MLSLAICYSSGNRELERAAAVLFPCVAVERSRLRDSVTADFSGRVTVQSSQPVKT